MSKTCIQNFPTILLPQELEEKRKKRAHEAYEQKKKLTKLKVKVEKVVEEKLSP